jgi:putative membrane protein
MGRCGCGARLALCLALVLASGPARAHLPDEPLPAWALHWTFEPWVLVLLAISAVGYAAGLVRLWRHAGRGRGVTVRQAIAFALGWLSLVVALVSPLDALGLQLFSAHMLQHEILMVVAAPLMCLSRPLVLWTWALPPSARRRVGGWTRAGRWRAFWGGLTAPASGWVLHAVALWAWHVPALFEASLHHEGVHTLQHASFLATALLFWWPCFRHGGPALQGRALVYLFTTMLHTGALGALLTLSPHVWYPSYGTTAPALGLDALEDQQLGGLLMWVPAGLAYVGVGLMLVARWAGLTQPAALAGSTARRAP